MGQNKKHKIINDKTSIIRPVEPPVPPPKVAQQFEDTKQALLDGLTPVQQDAHSVVDAMVDELYDKVDDALEYGGFDPVTDTVMIKAPNGDVMRVEKDSWDSGYYSVLDLHRFLQSSVEEYDVNMDKLNTEDQKMGYTPAPRPSIRQRSDNIAIGRNAGKVEKTPEQTYEEQSIQETELRNKLTRLPMHETMYVDTDCTVRRVPGGLIYTHKEGFSNTRTIATTFVPYK